MKLSQMLEKLNGPQKEAVETLNGPLLLLSGAGSGKTRVLTFRTVNLVAAGCAAPHEILCVTFTNKAAREMESRILALMSDVGLPVFERLWINTFHSFCVRLLRESAHLLEYDKFFSIYDSSDQLSMIKKVLNILKIDDKMNPPKGFQSRISMAKMKGLDPQETKKNKFFYDKFSQDVYERYEEEMRRANSMDFDDLLMKTYELFKSYPDVLERYQNRFRYIMVDEYQDTNHIQYLIVKALAQKHRNICVVGDEDQSIYSWRGADISNILDFEKDFKEAKVVKLEQNYRSTQTIVNAASALISHNSQRKAKTLFSEQDVGDAISVREEATEYDEARFVTRTIECDMNKGERVYKDFAVFYRTNAQSRVVEEQCRALGIPYRIVGGLRFYDRAEIKDVISYLKLILNPGDDIALKRVINVPARGIGKTTIEAIEEHAGKNKIRMIEATVHAVEQKIVHSGAQKKIAGFLDLLVELKDQASELSLKDLYTETLIRTGYVEALKKEGTPEADARIENLEELDNAIAVFEEERGEEATLQNFLEEMALVSETDNKDANADSITMMTLHVAKGLEFPIVFMVGMEEGLFPGGRATDSDDPTELEEERRLCYVGMTRARERLYMLFSKQRRLWGSMQFHQPSRFLNEIPKEYLDQKIPEVSSRFIDRMRTGFQSKSPASPTNPFPNYEDDLGDIFAPSGSGQSYKKGQKVKHPSYGSGAIFSVEGSGDQTRISVVFTDQTIKKFVAKFARLELL